MSEEGSARKVELQSNELEDMLGRVPGWITRNGMILFVILFALLLFGSWVYRYPDKKQARIVVTSVNPAADLKARTSGKIAGLFVRLAQLGGKAQYLDYLPKVMAMLKKDLAHPRLAKIAAMMAIFEGGQGMNVAPKRSLNDS